MSEIPEEDVWYPDEEFVMATHELMLKEYGEYLGFRIGIGVFKFIKDIRYCNVDEIEAWLRDGKVPQRSDEDSPENIRADHEILKELNSGSKKVRK